MSGDDDRQGRPDGSAWREAQRAMADRNEATRKKGVEERAAREREEAIRRHLRNQERQVNG